jgi:putative transposase
MESDRLISEVARDLGVHREALRERVRRAEADAGRRADLLTTAEREEIRRLRKENFELRRANSILKEASVFFVCQGARPRPTEVSAFIDRGRDRFGVEPICQTLGVSVSAYYERRTGERSARQVEDERLLGVIDELHTANYHADGYQRMWKALLRAGERVPRCRVQRLMRAHGIQGANRRGKPWRTTKADPAATKRPDLVKRDFTASALNRLWVGDFTYLRCWEGLLLFAFILDVFSRMIVGWQLAANMRTTLVLDALRMALGLREPGADFQLVCHTDAGSRPGLNRSSQQCRLS